MIAKQHRDLRRILPNEVLLRLHGSLAKMKGRRLHLQMGEVIALAHDPLKQGHNQKQSLAAWKRDLLPKEVLDQPQTVAVGRALLLI